MDLRYLKKSSIFTSCMRRFRISDSFANWELIKSWIKEKLARQFYLRPYISIWKKLFSLKQSSTV